jgi:hypothetical protein
MTTPRRTASTPRPARRPAGASRAGASRVVQLRLIGASGGPDWVLDAKTRRVGRAGVAEAREVLRRARPPQPVDRIAS